MHGRLEGSLTDGRELALLPRSRRPGTGRRMVRLRGAIMQGQWPTVAAALPRIAISHSRSAIIYTALVHLSTRLRRTPSVPMMGVRRSCGLGQAGADPPLARPNAPQLLTLQTAWIPYLPQTP